MIQVKVGVHHLLRHSHLGVRHVERQIERQRQRERQGHRKRDTDKEKDKDYLPFSQDIVEGVVHHLLRHSHLGVRHVELLHYGHQNIKNISGQGRDIDNVTYYGRWGNKGTRKKG